MVAVKIRDLLFLLGIVCAGVQTDTNVLDIAACNQPATDETIYVGLFVLTDQYFRSCSPYRGVQLTEYIRAFVGGIGLYFQDVMFPGIKIIFLGSRNLTDEEESTMFGGIRSEPDAAVKGVDALKCIEDLSLENDGFSGTNKLFLVLTRHSITEEETANTANTAPPPPPPPVSDKTKSSATSATDDYDDYALEERSSDTRHVVARSVSNKKKINTVGGLSHFGSLCFKSGAIVQDSGSNFSGVGAAALEIRNVLGPVYKGNLSRRHCSDYEDDPFQLSECNAAKYRKHEDGHFSCLNDSIDKAAHDVKTPSQFFNEHSGWTPCSASYIGYEECTEKPRETSYPHRNCSISCCLGGGSPSIAGVTPTLYSIPAPDGEECEERMICVGGQCVFDARSAERS